jgi:hypothetical protein
MHRVGKVKHLSTFQFNTRADTEACCNLKKICLFKYSLVNGRI